MSEEPVLPDGWENISFDLALDIVSDNGNKVKKGDYLEHGKYPVIDQGESKIGGFTNAEEFTISKPLPIFVFGDHTRRFKYMNTTFAPGADGVKLLSPTSIWHPGFLFYQLSNIDIENKGYSRHYQILKKKNLKLPPSNEQTCIVEKLDELLSDLDDGIAELKTAQIKLGQYRQSLLKSAVDGSLTTEWRKQNSNKITETGEQLLARILKQRRQHWEKQKLAEFAAKDKIPPKNWQAKYPEPVVPDTTKLLALPGGWVWASVDQLISGIEAGKNFKCVERPPIGNEYGVVKISAVTWGEYDEEQSKTSTTEKFENSNLLIKVGDFLFSRANTTELIGACVIAKQVSKNVMLSDKILRFLFVENSLKFWLLQYLRGPFGRQQIEFSASGNQASMKNISQEKLKSFAVPITSLGEINFIENNLANNFERIKWQIDNNNLQIKHAENQRKNILKDAFTGKLVPQDPNDEPASVLLEKIKAERAEQAKHPKPKRTKRKSRAMKKMDSNTLKIWVNELKQETFTFAELQKAFSGDYEELKEALFALLAEPNSVIEQIFDNKTGVLFQRTNG